MTRSPTVPNVLIGVFGAALGAYAEFITYSVGRFVAVGGGSLWAWVVVAAFSFSAYLMLKRAVNSHTFAALAIGFLVGYLSGSGTHWTLPIPP